MSISMKNHEDRISALEKQSQTPKAVFVTPDYSKATPINVNLKSYKVTHNGFIQFDLMADGVYDLYIKVNNNTIHSGYDETSTEVDYSGIIPVTVNDIITWNQYAQCGRAGIKFIPYRLTIL